MENFDPKLSELELKYEISQFLFSDPNVIEVALDDLVRRRGDRGPRFDIAGTDKFFTIKPSIMLPDKPFRIRLDRLVNHQTAPFPWTGRRFEEEYLMPNVNATVTMKERINSDSLTMRKEIDLACLPNQSVVEFFTMMGAQHYFDIKKNYYVWEIKPYMDETPSLVIATYMVCRPDGSDKRYFLEIEVEKTGTFDLKTRLDCLNENSKKLEKLPIGKPVNLSLYELYRPK